MTSSCRIWKFLADLFAIVISHLPSVDMSSSLVRRALELVETEPPNKVQPGKKTRKNDFVNDSKIQKKRKQCHSRRVLGDVKSDAALQVDIARKISSGKEDLTSQNLKKLVALGSSKSVDFKRAQKILERTVKTRKPVDEVVTEVSASAFTEEDFKKFEEEYFVS